VRTSAITTINTLYIYVYANHNNNIINTYYFFYTLNTAPHCKYPFAVAAAPFDITHSIRVMLRRYRRTLSYHAWSGGGRGRSPLFHLCSGMTTWWDSLMTAALLQRSAVIRSKRRRLFSIVHMYCIFIYYILLYTIVTCSFVDPKTLCCAYVVDKCILCIYIYIYNMCISVE